MGKGSGVAVSYGVGGRCGSDPTSLRLWHRPAATALIRLLAWEPPCATGAALEKTKKKKKKKKSKQERDQIWSDIWSCLSHILVEQSGGEGDPGQALGHTGNTDL